MALLNYDPRAATLYGPGNNAITPAQIKDYITSPGRTEKEILGAALSNKVNVNQISDAMQGDDAYGQAYTPDKIDAYLNQQGITRNNINPAQIKYEPITNVDANQDLQRGTVAGQLTNILDPNSPLMQRAATMGNQMSNRRGLLNSSIGVSAAMAPMIDAGLQIATPDAASNNSFNMFNVQNKNDVNKFNAANMLTADLTNAGNTKDIVLNTANNAKDIAMNNANLQNQMSIANLDAGTKLKIANIDALSKDSNLALSLNQSLMNAIVEINKQDKPVDVRQAEIEQLVNLTTQSIGLLQAFDSKVPALNFNDIMGNDSGTGNNQTGNSGNSGNSGKNSVNSSFSTIVPMNQLNTLNYEVEPSVAGNVGAYEKATGASIDRNKVVPERLVNDLLKAINPSSGLSYVGSDGQTHMANANAYDLNALMKQAGAKNYGELLSKLFQPVYVPGTGRADQIMFYMYR